MMSEHESVVTGVRLSPQQRLRWLDHERRGVTHARLALRLEGDLDVVRLQAALDEVTERHEILRARFVTHAQRRFPLLVTDEVARMRLAVGCADDVVEAPGSLDRAPLLKATLIREGTGVHRLVLSLPALAADGATLLRLADALRAAYAGDAVDEEPVQYTQYAEWQNEICDELAPPAAPSEAPVRLAIEAVAEVRLPHARHRVTVDDALAARLAACAAEHGCSLAALLLSALTLQLARHHGQRDLTIAIEGDGRALDDVRDVLGPVAAFSAQSLRVEQDAPLAVQLRRAEAALREAAWHERMPEVPTLAEQVGFSFVVLAPGERAAGVRWEATELLVEAAGPKLMLCAVQRAGALELSFQHASERYTAHAVEQLAAQYRVLLESFAHGEVANVVELSMLPARERAMRLMEGRGARATAEPRALLHRRVEVQAAKRPDQLAIVCGKDALTYAALNQRANQLAHRLRRFGAALDVPIAVLCDRSLEAVVGLLAILKAGAAYVPLDPMAPSERLATQLRQTGCPLTIVHRGIELPRAATRLVHSDDPSLHDEPSHDLGIEVPADALASIVFTSGSTGVPKGVQVTARGIASYAEALVERLGLTPALHFASVSTLTADLGNTALFGALATGGCLHLIDYETATSGARFARYCKRHPIDVLKLVPSHLSALLDAEQGAAVLPRRHLVLGGEPLPLPLAERIAELAPECGVVNHYGPTESTVGVLALPLASLVDTRGCTSVPLGRPLDNAESYVLDAALEPAPMGTVGELYVGGAGLARGYAGCPGLTAERFVPHPFFAGARLYRTGDLARYRAEGSIEFVGRRDHQLKIRGFRVELGEIEAQLRTSPEVAQAVVQAREDARGATTLVAYVVARAAALGQASLRAHLAERLPDYMIPSELMLLESLPLTPNGKVDRRALPAPDRARRAYVAPRTPTEHKLARIWCEILRVPEVGVDDDFFALGGHSLLAIPLMHRIQQALGGAPTLSAIFEAPTVARLAALLEERRENAGLLTLRAGGALPPLFCIDPTGSHAAAYQPLADALSGARPVLAVALTPALAADGSLTQVIARLCATIRAAQASGPYHLVGWSLGGVLALGIARQLEAAGQQVAFVAVLDSDPRSDLYAGPAPDPIEELAGYLAADKRAALIALSAAARARLRARVSELTEEARVEAAVAWAQEHGLLPDDASPAAYLPRYALLRAAAELAASLPPAGIDAAIAAWWSEETLARHGRPPIEVSRLTRGFTENATVAGDHEALLGSSQVATQLERALSRAGVSG